MRKVNIRGEKHSPAHWPVNGGDWSAAAVLGQALAAVGFFPAVGSWQQWGRRWPGHKLQRCHRGGWKACLVNQIQRGQKPLWGELHTLIIQHLTKANAWIMFLVTGKETPKHGPREESQQELTTLAALEVQFAAQKCTTVCSAPWWIFTDFSHLLNAFWSACFGLTTNLTDKLSAALCQPVILCTSHEYPLENQKIIRKKSTLI